MGGRTPRQQHVVVPRTISTTSLGSCNAQIASRLFAICTRDSCYPAAAMIARAVAAQAAASGSVGVSASFGGLRTYSPAATHQAFRKRRGTATAAWWEVFGSRKAQPVATEGEPDPHECL